MPVKYRLLSKDAFDKQMKVQNYKCAICDRPLLGDKQTHIDHNHFTNKVREILCGRCNNCIGNAKEDITTLANLILYLEKYGN